MMRWSVTVIVDHESLVGLLHEEREAFPVDRADTLECGLVDVDDLVEIIGGDLADGHVMGSGGRIHRHLAHSVSRYVNLGGDASQQAVP